MTATMWTQDGCIACREEKTLLLAEGFDVTEVIVTEPKEMDRDAFVQLQMQNDAFPVVMINGEFRTPAKASKAMSWED